MSTLLIEGGHRLSGRIEVEGNKNAALPLLAACLLTEHECVLTNVPRIADVEVMARLLLDLGAEVEGIGTTTLRVRCPEVTKDEPDPIARGPAARLGPAPRPAAGAARAGRARAARRRLPGSPHDQHASRRAPRDGRRARSGRAGHALQAPDGLTAVSMYLDEASVTATETALLAAAGAPGVTEIRHAATEPHVVELCRVPAERWASASRAPARRASASRAAARLGPASHAISGDYIEAGSWAVVAAITGGAIDVMGARAEDVEAGRRGAPAAERAMHVRGRAAARRAVRR